MTRAIVRTDAFEADVEEAFDYGLGSFGQAHTERFLIELENTGDLLSRFPNAGAEVSGMPSGIRSFMVGPYRLYYRVEADEIVLIRFIRGERQRKSSDLV